ncbi:Uncharacterized protein HZ326_22439 [Fusarium oxysporum f. sp. albedinis]|nr:Uncharacterized protein HZ326_22439 [Fusarium oxysporum f. sp. albedinis]
MRRSDYYSWLAINAEGQSIAPFIIGAGQYHLANWYRESNLPADWVIATSQNGWTNNELGLEWLKHFDRSTSNRSVGAYRLLILDGHESHHSADFERYCQDNKIITLLLKQAYGRQIEHLIRCSITHISKTEFFPAFYAAFKATFTESNIRGATNPNASWGDSGRIIEKWWSRKVVIETSGEEYGK